MMLQLAAPSISPGYGVREVSSFHQFPSKRLLAFLDRLEGTTSVDDIYDMADIGIVVDLQKQFNKPIIPQRDNVEFYVNPDAYGRVFSPDPVEVSLVREAPGEVGCRTVGAGRVVLSEMW